MDESRSSAGEPARELHREAFEQAHDAFLILEGDRVADCNRRAVELFGVARPDDLLGRRLADMAAAGSEGDADPAGLCDQELQRAEAGGRAQFELAVQPDGQPPFITSVDFTRIDLPDHWCILATLREGELRDDADETMRQREWELAEAQRTARVGHWVSDLHTGRVFWSRVVYELLGVREEDVQARFDRFVELVHPDDRDALPENAVPSLEEPEPRSHEYRVIRPDGAVRWIHELVYADRDATGNVLRLHGTLQDVTERRQFEEELQRRIELERLVRNISTRFLSAASGAFDDVLTRTLSDIARHAGADRCYLIQACENGVTAGTTHEWCADGVPSQREHCEDQRIQDYPWLLEALSRHEPLEIGSADALPEGSMERRAFERSGSRSTLLAPLVIQGHLRAVLGFDAVHAPRHWPWLDRELFQISADILASALSRRALELRLERDAFHDGLTGTANRRHMEDALRREMARAERHGERFALVMFDLDHFKAVNDTYGHEVGDAVLRQISTRVEERLRESDLLGRWGGEEFLVLCPDTLGDGAEQLAEDIRRTVEGTEFPGAGRVTVSLGVADYRIGEDLKEAMKRLDDALYTAKRTGRNRVVVAGRPAGGTESPG